MARIEDAIFQDDIANSLLGPEAEQEQAPEQTESEYAVHGDDLLDEAIAEHDVADRFGNGDERVETRRQERPETETSEQPQERLRSERAPQESEQRHAPTPEEVQAGVERLDSGVKEFGLNEPADARQFADEFCGAFGTDVYKAGVDVGALGGVMAKTALSAIDVYHATGGDLSKMGEIPAQNAQAFAHDLLKGMGVDPRSMNVDAMLLARTTLGGMINFLNTYQSYGGKVTDLAKLNDPQQAEFYMQNFMRALGIEGQINREAALKFADACAKQMLRVMGKISQVNEQRAASQERQPRGRSRGQRVPAGMREGIRGSKAPRFKSNQDVFDGGTMDYYQQQHGRL
jgi:hypothetical protein